MLNWSLVGEEDKSYTLFANTIQLTLFAVSKSEKRSRLISWPRIQNDALPDPPNTSLPNPSLFEAVEVNGPSPSAVYFDVENMFHNIILLRWLAKLFPMQPIRESELDIATIHRIRRQIPSVTENTNLLPRSCQATMPMGFKWAVYIAQSFVAGCLDHAYKLFRMSRLAPADLDNPHTLSAERAPFIVNSKTPLILHIIDDVTLVATEWTEEEFMAWHRITRRVLALNKLPVNTRKSCTVGHIERSGIEFIGCYWNFATMAITPKPEKLAQAILQSKIFIRAGSIATREWQRIVGKLVCIATLNRPLMACMQRVFASANQYHNQIMDITQA